MRGGEEEDGTVESKKSGEGIGVEILERQSDEVSCGQAHKETFLSDIRITPEVSECSCGQQCDVLGCLMCVIRRLLGGSTTTSLVPST